ncbi:hypothetical protein A7W90_15850 [Clostridium sp. Bc-iso-3]|nr:hypothetical protein A7W90_15850 [Clostridium sp. Bc-iso-3]
MVFLVCLSHRPGNGVSVVDEGFIRNADQLDVAFAGVIPGGEPINGAVVAASVGIVEVPGGEDVVAKGEDGTQIVHQLHFQVFRGGGFGQAVGRGLLSGSLFHVRILQFGDVFPFGVYIFALKANNSKSIRRNILHKHGAWILCVLQLHSDRW